MAARLKPQDICVTSPSPWQCHYEARTMLPLKDCVHDAFLMDVRSMLKAGDQVTICRYDRLDPSHRLSKLMELAMVRVIESTRDRVRVALLGEIVVMPDPDELPAEPPAPERRAGEGWTARHIGGGVYGVYDASSVEVWRGPRAKCEAIAAGLEPVPPAVPQAA